MRGLVCGSLAAVLLAFPLAGSAHGWWFGWRARACYYPVPVTVVPAYQLVYTAPVPVYARPTALVCPPAAPLPAARPYARPAPAGPSGTPTNPSTPSATPRGGEPPRVSESRSYFDAYAAAPRAGDKPAGVRCPVGFWNLTEHDVQLTVAGQNYSLPRGKNVKLELDRQFVWRVDQREPQSERIPASESALEIVIRR
jgi:hypothetical protein